MRWLAGRAAPRSLRRPKTTQPSSSPAPAGESVFNPLNLDVVRRLAAYNRALRCRWPAVAAWNCTTCRNSFAVGSTHLRTSYLTTANAPGYDPERGVVITTQDKVGGGGGSPCCARRACTQRCTAQSCTAQTSAAPAAGGGCTCKQPRRSLLPGSQDLQVISRRSALTPTKSSPYHQQDGFTVHYDELLSAAVLTFSSTRG